MPAKVNKLKIKHKNFIFLQILWSMFIISDILKMNNKIKKIFIVENPEFLFQIYLKNLGFSTIKFLEFYYSFCCDIIIKIFLLNTPLERMF